MQCVVFQLGMMNTHLRSDKIVGFVDLFDVVYSFAEAVFNMSNLFRPGVVKEDRFFVAQPDMIVMIDPAESNGSR